MVATLEMLIDPTGAEQGANRVVRAFNDIDSALKRTSRTFKDFDVSSGRTGIFDTSALRDQSFLLKQMGDSAEKAGASFSEGGEHAATFSRSVGRALDATLGLDHVFGSIIRHGVYFLGADVIAHALGFHGVIDLVSKTLGAVGEAVDSVSESLREQFNPGAKEAAQSTAAWDEILKQAKKDLDALKATSSYDFLGTVFNTTGLSDKAKEEFATLADEAKKSQEELRKSLFAPDTYTGNAQAALDEITESHAKQVQRLQAALERLRQYGTNKEATAAWVEQEKKDFEESKTSQERYQKDYETNQERYLDRIAKEIEQAYKELNDAEKSAFEKGSQTQEEANRRNEESQAKYLKDIDELRKKEQDDWDAAQKAGFEKQQRLDEEEQRRNEESQRKEEELLGKTAEEAKKRMEERNKQFGQKGSDIFESFIDGSVRAQDAVKELGKTIEHEIYQRLIGDQIAGFFSGVIGNVFGTHARGDVFSGGHVTPLAYGGVVNSPTMFGGPYDRHVIGEAGPEGVLPLKRTPDGQLGVRASGVGGGVTVNVYARDADSFRRSSRQISREVRRVYGGR